MCEIIFEWSNLTFRMFLWRDWYPLESKMQMSFLADWTHWVIGITVTGFTSNLMISLKWFLLGNSMFTNCWASISKSIYSSIRGGGNLTCLTKLNRSKTLLVFVPPLLLWGLPPSFWIESGHFSLELSDYHSHLSSIIHFLHPTSMEVISH